MTERIAAKVAVVGGGPGGYVAAIRAGQLGLDTVLIESGALGGTCLNRGCIPSKAIIHAADAYDSVASRIARPHLGIRVDGRVTLDLPAMIQWKDQIVGQLNRGVAGLLRKAKVRCVKGWAEFEDAQTCRIALESGGMARLSAEHVVLATGSIATSLPNLPWSESVLSSTEALALTELPDRLAIIGGGYIGMELGFAFRKLGAEVTIIEALDRILPHYDSALVTPVVKSAKAKGIEIRVNTRALRYADGRLVLDSSGQPSGEIEARKVLVTVGRRPLIQDFGLERMGVKCEEGFIRIDDQCRTSMENVWAIGDVTGEPMLAHRASAQGILVAEIIAGLKRRFDPAAIPAICFTDPEIVTVGLSADAAKAKGLDPQTADFPLAANGRALTLEAGQSGGFIRVVAARQDRRILGLAAVGPGVSELSGEMVSLIEMGAVLDDLSLIIHAHPTLSETLHEAAALALGHPIHI